MAFDLAIASMTVFCEASGQSPEARRAVVWVIFNRLASGRFGRSIAEICLKRFQFSEWNGDAGNNGNLLRVARALDGDPVLLDCMAAYHEVAGRQTPDPTGGATHYHDTSIAPPLWTLGATETARIDEFVFYKGVQ